MRTKALLGLAALAVSAATCVAQSNVYSLNIVGYVNVPVKAGLNLLSNPLKPSDGNYNITNTIVLPNTAENAELYKWDVNKWSSNIPSWVADFGWFSAGGDTTIGLGEAFFLKSPIATQITFVGEVATGDVAYQVPTGISVIAPKTPVEQAFPGKDVGHENDAIYTWTGTGWGSAWTWVTDYGWFNEAPGSSVEGPTIPVGGGLVYQNTGGALNWTRPFNP